MPWPFLPQFPTGPLFSCPPSLQTHYCSYFRYESTHSPPRQGLELGIHTVIWRSSFCPAWMWLTPRVSILGACRSACPLLVICPSFLSLLAHLSLPGWLWVFFLHLSPWDCLQPHLFRGSVSSCHVQLPLTCHFHSPGSPIKMSSESEPDMAICGVLTFVITTSVWPLKAEIRPYTPSSPNYTHLNLTCSTCSDKHSR